MSSTLDRVPADATALRLSIADALSLIANIGTEEQAKEAFDRVRLAKEWAKIRKVAREVRMDLLRLELALLRKVGQLRVLTAVPTTQRPVAEFFASKTDAQINELLAQFGEGATSPLMVYRRATAEEDHSAARRRVTSGEYAESEHYVADETREWAVKEYAGDLKAGLAAVLEHYYEEDNEGFSIIGLAEQVCDSVGLDQRSAIWGTREGLLEVCRKAVRDAPSVAVNGTEVPRFITCLDRTSPIPDKWIRVPFHVATLDQLRDMVDLRRQQAATAKAVAENLVALWCELDARLDETESARRVPLGDLAARVAFTRAADVA